MINSPLPESPDTLREIIQDQEEVLDAADKLAAEHAALLELVESHVTTIRGMAERIVNFQNVLASEGKHQLTILVELRDTLVDIAISLEDAL